MAKFVYAIVYDGSKNFAAFVKNKYGHFFSKDRVVILSPKRPLNGASKFAFPGGGLDEGEEPVAGAIREFYEETNYNLTKYETTPQFLTRQSDPHTYYGVYFKVANLDEIIGVVTESLNQGNQAAQNVKDETITTYAKIRQTYLSCPPDNELASVAIWNLEDDKDDKIAALEKDDATNWFFDILGELHAQFKAEATQ